jgi:ketosteroid isomerase-like protein
MSRENVEAFKRGLDAYNRRDIDAMLEQWAPDVVLDWSNARNFDAGVFRGHDEVRAFTQRFLDTWEEVRVELPGDPVEVGDDVLVVENVAHMRGRDGIEVQARSAWLIAMRDRKVASFTLYQTKREALEAAGLSE